MCRGSRNRGISLPIKPAACTHLPCTGHRQVFKSGEAHAIPGGEIVPTGQQRTAASRQDLHEQGETPAKHPGPPFSVLQVRKSPTSGRAPKIHPSHCVYSVYIQFASTFRPEHLEKEISYKRLILLCRQGKHQRIAPKSRCAASTADYSCEQFMTCRKEKGRRPGTCTLWSSTQRGDQTAAGRCKQSCAGNQDRQQERSLLPPA